MPRTHMLWAEEVRWNESGVYSIMSLMEELWETTPSLTTEPISKLVYLPPSPVCLLCWCFSFMFMIFVVLCFVFSPLFIYCFIVLLSMDLLSD